MKKTTTLIAGLFIFFNICFAQLKDEQLIKKVMDEQLSAWNSGNINDFMKTYWQNDSLMFIGKNGVTYGWQKTLDNYKNNYPNKATMGKLDFTILQTKHISKFFYFVVGKWHLKRTIGDIGGAFTLLFKKINGKWLIIADHSS